MRVVELFAGVGGFRIGLEGPPGSPRDEDFAVVWSNQWEPSTKKQHAAEVYAKRWSLTESKEKPLHFIGDGEVFVNDDIATIDVEEIPDHDLLVGGFPCQDYSVAKTAKDATGIEGKKGVLWWEIHRILSGKKPGYAMLENVDRLLKSPTKQRGRDFAVMLSSLTDLGYVVEWRVINAADYGMPQRRRRVFIMAYAPGTPQHEALKNEENIKQWIETDGTFAKAFPIKPLSILFAIPSQLKGPKDTDLADVSLNFNKGANSKSKSPFKKSGIVVGNNYYTYDTIPKYDGPITTLADILLPASKVPMEYVIQPDSVLKAKGWKYLKGAKDEARKGTDDFTYRYKEGPMVFPDSLDRPSRTIITGEGGSTPSRFKHVVKFKASEKLLELSGLKPSPIENPWERFWQTKTVPQECLDLRQRMNAQVRDYESYDLDLSELNDKSPELSDNNLKAWTEHGPDICGNRIYFGKPGRLVLKSTEKYDKSQDMRCMVLSDLEKLPPGNDIEQLENWDFGIKLFEMINGKSQTEIADVFRLLARMCRPSLSLDHSIYDDMVHWNPNQKIVDRINQINENLLKHLMLIEAVAINEDSIYLENKEGKKIDQNMGRYNFIGRIALLVQTLLDDPKYATNPMAKENKRQFNSGLPKPIVQANLRKLMQTDIEKIPIVQMELGLQRKEWLRRLTPVELERLNMFPDNHTEGTTDGKRAFFMGNALVIGIVERLGNEIKIRD